MELYKKAFTCRVFLVCVFPSFFYAFRDGTKKKVTFFSEVCCRSLPAADTRLLHFLSLHKNGTRAALQIWRNSPIETMIIMMIIIIKNHERGV